MKASVKNFHQAAGTNFKPEMIFSKECSSCHAGRAKNQSGENLFKAVCQVCHKQEGIGLALDAAWFQKQPSSQTRIAIVKGIKRMPGFASAHGGPLDNSQLESLLQYLKGVASLQPADAQKAKNITPVK